MQLKARMLGQPLGNRRGLMTAAVVQNQVQIQLLVSLPVNRAQELQKLLRPMPLRNAREHLAVSDIEGRIEIHRAVAFIVVRAPFLPGR